MISFRAHRVIVIAIAAVGAGGIPNDAWRHWRIFEGGYVYALGLIQFVDHCSQSSRLTASSRARHEDDPIFRLDDLSKKLAANLVLPVLAPTIANFASQQRAGCFLYKCSPENGRHRRLHSCNRTNQSRRNRLSTARRRS